MKWETESENYRFVIEQREDTFNLTVYDLGNIVGIDWFRSLQAAKTYVRREFAGIVMGRFKKILS